MSKTKIEWADRVWNPITGCTKVSPGCQNCYAERMSHRLKAMGQERYKDGFKVAWHYPALDEPEKWKKPSKVFVCSMGDVFHELVPFEFLDEVMSVIAFNSQHTFLLLTKRPEKMKQYFKQLNFIRQPIYNLWLGVTAENQEQADKRIPILLQIPAVKRFVSVEPMLGPVDLTVLTQIDHEDNEGYGVEPIKGLDWVICGGESGPGARPMHPDWVRSLRDQCKDANVPFMFKQWGEWAPYNGHGDRVFLAQKSIIVHYHEDDIVMAKIGKKKAGRLLDGQLLDQSP